MSSPEPALPEHLIKVDCHLCGFDRARKLITRGDVVISAQCENCGARSTLVDEESAS